MYVYTIKLLLVRFLNFFWSNFFCIYTYIYIYLQIIKLLLEEFLKSQRSI